MKFTQQQFVINELETTGEVTRNTCLKNYISRLGAIICELKKDGWEFETYTRSNVKPDSTKGKDFIYKLVKRPMPTFNE